MWQVLLAAAAAAGSGILANKFIHAEKPISDCHLNNPECDQIHSFLHSDDAIEENINADEREAFAAGVQIYRFSCPETGFKEFRKNGFGRIKKNGGPKRGKKNAALGGDGKQVVGNQIGNGSGKKISICLKKRRTGKNAVGKCESCASKEKSFGWGVSLGVMCMMSAGNAEITKLNSAMNETVKTVQELKAEISRRQSSHNVNVSVADNEAETNTKFVDRSCNGPLFTKSVSNNIDTIKAFDPAMIEGSECTSSILTVDHQQPEEMEMHRLEVELESELQKLPWDAMEGSGSVGRTEIFKAEDLAKGLMSDDSNLFPCNGVKPAELDQKLCHLLIERQESQIVELESELHRAHSKLHQKEVELQALKDCVKRLTEFSLTNDSDDETEEDVITIPDGSEEKMEFESTKSMIGMKRTLGYEAYICSKN